MNTEKERLAKKYHSPTHYILSGLIPYTEANLKLAFAPNAFFNDLEKLDTIKANKKALKSAYYRAIKKGLVKIDDSGIPRLTEKGLRKTKTFKPKKLKGAKLMIIFDIPEEERPKRQRLRALLRELAFRQVQKSVWVSDFDHREYIRAEINEAQLQGCVELFESRTIK
jgi:DNA-binding transcriptional regulator PaaX